MVNNFFWCVCLEPGVLGSEVGEALLVHVESLPLHVYRLLGPQDVLLALVQSGDLLPG